jgi:hypothetical protein
VASFSTQLSALEREVAAAQVQISEAYRKMRLG